jgi:endonuclease YncB( thermonuclease family)
VRRRWLQAWLAGACWLASALAQASERSGWVSWVIDGDTVMVLLDGQSEPVRLRVDGIDAPERCQNGGEAARDALIGMALRKTVQVQGEVSDVYGRLVGRLKLDGVDLGAEMVRAGMAWAWHYQSGRGPYARLQREAQQAGQGLFGASAQPMAPALFRRFHGPCEGAGPD